MDQLRRVLHLRQTWLTWDRWRLGALLRRQVRGAVLWAVLADGWVDRPGDTGHTPCDCLGMVASNLRTLLLLWRQLLPPWPTCIRGCCGSGTSSLAAAPKRAKEMLASRPVLQPQPYAQPALLPCTGSRCGGPFNDDPRDSDPPREPLERATGLTFIQRVRLRRQLEAGGIVEPPVFMCRFGGLLNGLDPLALRLPLVPSAKLPVLVL